MASIIKIKRSTTPSSAPSSLAAGELAINIPDKKLYSSDGSTVFEIGDYALANTNAYIASVAATELSHLANTNAYIASVSSTERAALANTNSYIASVQSDVDANEATERAALANTNAYIASVSSTERAALANTNAYIASVQSDVDANEATERAALANTNAYIASVQSDVDANEATERAALANTNAYIATKADASNPSTSGFFNHTGRLTVGTNLTVSGNTHIDGNLTVEGGVTYISSSTLNVDDSMIKLAANNAADTIDTGAYGKYVESATTKYAGYFRDATDGVFKFYGSLESEPTTTVNTGGTGYTLAQVDAIIDGGTY